MIPILIYILSRKFRNHGTAGLPSYKFLAGGLYIVFIWLILFLLLIPSLSKAQNIRLNYKIVQGGDDIGWLRLEKNITGTRSNLLLVSEIKTRFLFLITVSAKESSTYENGRLLYSSQFRKTNGDTKLDKETRLVDDKYEVVENGEKERLPIPFIGANLLCLYFHEPLGINIVYCDNHECFVKVTKTDDGGYRVKFPDGNSNTYYYTNGTCIKVKVTHTFYSAEIILNS